MRGTSVFLVFILMLNLTACSSTNQKTISEGTEPPSLSQPESGESTMNMTIDTIVDSSKVDTGVFFFRGKAGSPFAILNAGGGFMYVGTMHDSFPHALEVSKQGYNAFALIYRPITLMTI